ncbi:MAG TPA: metallophosphoesterase [Acidimicrobiia bacterium]|jgi:Icc-related predicted phosphoesterase|nr:metallophosphoesterase [Acidimicrobiia bacterium]
MLLVSDVHGASGALARVAASGEPLLILGDLINFIDYRDNSGILSDVVGQAFTDDLVRLRTAGEYAAASALWGRYTGGREREVRAGFDAAVTDAYEEIVDAIAGAEVYVTYGNVDRPDLMREILHAPNRFVDTEVIEIDGQRIGIAGGGMRALGTPGEVSEEQMAAKLSQLGPVDILCTHVPPAIPALARDVVGGQTKSFRSVLDYIEEHQPRFHYFGDIHQPQAVAWTIGRTQCRNVGYFRATGRPYRHDPDI